LVKRRSLASSSRQTPPSGHLPPDPVAGVDATTSWDGAGGCRTGGRKAEHMTSSSATGDRFKFVVPGDCVPWARAAGGKTGHRFTPAKQARYMAALKLICQAAMKGAPPLEGPVSLEIMAHYAWPKKRQPGAWRGSRPDLDNIMKLVGDALNGVAWIDDAQIAAVVLRKLYSDLPGLNVKFEAL
jgi:Holliday junction resolvase RusA-like endonuclease